MKSTISTIKENDYPALAIAKVSELKALVTLHDIMESMGIASVDVKSEEKYDDNNYYTQYSFENYQCEKQQGVDDNAALHAFAEGVRKHIFAHFTLDEDDTSVQALLDNAGEWEFDYEFDELAQAHIIHEVFYGKTQSITQQDVMQAIEERINNYIPVVKRFFCDLTDVAA